MSYTTKNYPTKKALKLDVEKGLPVRAFNPGLGPDLSDYSGTVYLEGPHYPRPHTWYAQATMVNGLITKVK